LQTGGRALWERHNNGDNLLFTEADLQAPVKSPLFRELLTSPDGLTVTMATRMIDALRGDVGSASLLADLGPEPERPRGVPGHEPTDPDPDPAPGDAGGVPAWLPALREAWAEEEDVLSLPPPPIAAWLEDVSRASSARPPAGG
jgi:hypothetical protein